VRWLADENIHKAIVQALREASHDVVSIAEIAPQTEDDRVADLARRERRIVLTEDKDFGEMTFKDRRETSGIVLLRFTLSPWQPKWRRLAEVISSQGDALVDQFTVIDETRARVQALDRG
jgi:predicted nuclease of predicted toxin-antitoxin system